MEETRTIEDVIQDDEIQNLKQRIEDAETTARQGKSIKMGRVPHKTHDEFKDMAEAMFCDDYGMTLTFLHEYYKINEQNKEMFNTLEQRIRPRTTTQHEKKTMKKPIQTRWRHSMVNEDTKSKLAQIQGKSDKLEVGGVEFEINPLTNEEFTDFLSELEGEQGVDMDKVMKKMCVVTLQKDDPSITYEEFKDAPAELTIKLIDKIEEVNGLQDFFSEAEIEEAKKQL